MLAPQPGIEPVPSALGDKILTTGPPGKSSSYSHIADFIINPLASLSFWGETWTRGQFTFCKCFSKASSFLPSAKRHGPWTDMGSNPSCVVLGKLRLSFCFVFFGVEYYSLVDLPCVTIARFKSKSRCEDIPKS